MDLIPSHQSLDVPQPKIYLQPLDLNLLAESDQRKVARSTTLFRRRLIKEYSRCPISSDLGRKVIKKYVNTLTLSESQQYSKLLCYEKHCTPSLGLSRSTKGKNTGIRTNGHLKNNKKRKPLLISKASLKKFNATIADVSRFLSKTCYIEISPFPTSICLVN